MSKKSILAASVCLASLAFASTAFATPPDQIYGTYTDSVTNVTAGDNGPSIDNNGLPQGNAGTQTYFTVNGLTVGGPAGDANQGGGLLFTVDPAGCITSHSCGGGTETADINITMDFYTSTGTLLGTLSDTALATFNYTNQTDNLCWLDGSVGGTAVTGHSAAGGACNAPGSGANPTGFEQIAVTLNGSNFNIDLHDWNDWKEQPNITFQLTCNTNCGAGHQGNPVPEPLTLSLFGAGLAGAAALRRRKKKVA